MIDLVKHLAVTPRRTKASVIRELLKITNKPGIISFAGGLPDPKCFPYDFVREAAAKVIDRYGSTALQYGPTAGLDELKKAFVRYLKKYENIEAKPENLIITTASQQSLDMIGRLFIDASDPILVEKPSYMGALQVFRSYGAEFVGVNMDDDGISIDDLEKQLITLKKLDEHYKFLYLITDFHNPCGITLKEEKRVKLVELSKKYDLVIVEDLPYRQIRFEGESPRTLYRIDQETLDTHNIISMYTFSKIFAPGLRLGVILAHPDIIRKLEILKQSLDLCTSSLSQLIAVEFLESGYMDEHLKKVNSGYKIKKDAMLAALEKYMPEGVTWTKPEGGLFLWVRLPENISADEMFEDAVNKDHVAYVIGSAFHCDGSGQNTMRLNFSFATPEEIDEGIRRLAEAVKKRIA